MSMNKPSSWTMRGVRWPLVAGAVVLSLGLITAGVVVAEDDPFAAGTDALAVKEGDASSSLRAKLKLTKVGPEMLVVQVQQTDDRAFPDCVVQARVMMAAKAVERELKLIGRGNVYRFAPMLKRKGKQVELTDQATQSNLGLCYYAKGTLLVLKLGGVDLKSKTFNVAETYLK